MQQGGKLTPVTATELIAERIRREGSITFDAFMEVALYDSEHGFFASGHGAGRAGRDFVTAPRSARCTAPASRGDRPHVARSLGSPDPFLVVDAGAGNGRLAREVLRAAPDCSPRCGTCSSSGRPSCARQQRELLPIEPADEALGPFAMRTSDEEMAPVHAAGPVFAALPDLPEMPVDTCRVRERAARQPAVRHSGVGRQPLERGARRARQVDASSSCWSRGRRPRCSDRAGRRTRGPVPARACRSTAASKRGSPSAAAAAPRRRRRRRLLATSPSSSRVPRMAAHLPRARARATPARRARRAGHHRRRRASSSSCTRHCARVHDRRDRAAGRLARRARDRRARRRRSHGVGGRAPRRGDLGRARRPQPRTRRPPRSPIPTGLGAHRVRHVRQTTRPGAVQ